jgi:hypothetical protein
MQNSLAEDSIQVWDNNPYIPPLGYLIQLLNSFDYETLTFLWREFCRKALQINKKR